LLASPLATPESTLPRSPDAPLRMPLPQPAPVPRLSAPSGTLVHVAPPLCKNCEEEVAIIHCMECDKLFCEECNSVTHRKGTVPL
jgi:hypothetical protein